MTEPMPHFITLTPPAGGLQRLRQSVHTDDVAPRRVLWPAWAVGALTAGVLALVLAPYGLARYRADTLTRALQQALTPAARTSPIDVAHGAAMELPSANANVRVYLVQTLPPG